MHAKRALGFAMPPSIASHGEAERWSGSLGMHGFAEVCTACPKDLPRNIEFRFEFRFPEGELETELETELALQPQNNPIEPWTCACRPRHGPRQGQYGPSRKTKIRKCQSLFLQII